MRSLTLSILLVSCGICFAQVPPNNFEPSKSIVYKQTKGKPLSLHVFLPEGWKATDKRPAAVFFFGGGWVGGSPRQFYPQCHLLAERGMASFARHLDEKQSEAIRAYVISQAWRAKELQEAQASAAD